MPFMADIPPNARHRWNDPGLDLAAQAPEGTSDDFGLVCDGCGEGFDSLDTAAAHATDSENTECEEAQFTLKPIEEVF